MFLTLLVAASEPVNATDFSKRVAYADSLEAKPAVLSFFRETLYPDIGSNMSTAMRDCTSVPDANTATFVILLDITDGGMFENVAVQPMTNTAECFASAMVRLRLPTPPSVLPRPLTLGIKMTVKP